MPPVPHDMGLFVKSVPTDKGANLQASPPRFETTSVRVAPESLFKICCCHLASRNPHDQCGLRPGPADLDLHLEAVRALARRLPPLLPADRSAWEKPGKRPSAPAWLESYWSQGACRSGRHAGGINLCVCHNLLEAGSGELTAGANGLFGPGLTKLGSPAPMPMPSITAFLKASCLAVLAIAPWAEQIPDPCAPAPAAGGQPQRSFLIYGGLNDSPK